MGRMKAKPLYVRLEDEQQERFDALVEERRAAAGVDLSPSQVLRLVVERGLAALESEKKQKRAR